jgi:hypothetical protein
MGSFAGFWGIGDHLQGPAAPDESAAVFRDGSGHPAVAR